MVSVLDLNRYNNTSLPFEKNLSTSSPCLLPPPVTVPGFGFEEGHLGKNLIFLKKFFEF
jgi:hypothetical protein